jgi:prepilin-type N-terminal cleavage/methylation domain-containing protein
MRAQLRFRSQSGLTLLEMTVAVSLIGIVSAVFLPLLATATRSVNPMQAQSVAIDDLRNSLGTIGREIRSAVCVAQPAANAASGNVLSFTTEANGSPYSVTYTVTGGQLLRQVDGSATVTLVASGLVVPSDAFTYLATPRRSVRITLHFQPYSNQPARDLTTVMAGRNSWHNCS